MALRILWTVTRLLWTAAMIAAPLFGFWLASSLAAYQNASQWLALLVGLALFPILPVGWELFYAWRRSRKKVPPKQILTRLDRLVLRTLIINALFLGGMLGFARQTALHAVAQRGDWMFDGYSGSVAQTFRGWLLGLADQLESHHPEQHFGTSDKAPEKPEAPPQKPPGEQPAPGEPPVWPQPEAADPAVVNMPDEVQRSIETVGAYLRDHFPDPRARTKAIHDYVVLRLTYDEATFHAIIDHSGEPAPQDAESVFAARTGVCEGYARLMVALGKASDVEIAYVAGSIRDAQRRVADGDEATVKAALEGYGHAWNAVKLDGRWELIDATWDDPTGGAPRLRSTYLFVPPRLMLLNHLPDSPAWQLVDHPMSPGEFVRQPMMSPDIGRYGLTLLDPTRAQVSVAGEIAITLDNPQKAAVMADVRLDGSRGEGKSCEVASVDRRTLVHCKLGDGAYEIELFAGEPGAMQLEYVGSLLANSR
ncbi:MAG TPA: transglutaminase domain-containing protein [Kofleriaceae bacterium]|nr:transglutaminase domain-containing protein [Kofleriaceae bacterium]